MAVRIERTDGLVLMSTEELFAEVGRKTGDIVIRMSAEALNKPGAFFQIKYQSDQVRGKPRGSARGSERERHRRSQC